MRSRLMGLLYLVNYGLIQLYPGDEKEGQLPPVVLLL